MRLGILREITTMALDSIKTHKLRSFLTLLGIVIGVMTVIGMVSIIQGLNRAFLSELESVGSDLILVSKYEPGIQIGRLSEEERKRKDLTFEDGIAIEKESSLIRAVAMDMVADVYESITIKYQNIKTQDALVIGMNEKFPQVLSVYLPEKGRFITVSDVLHSTRVCVLGSELAETLFPHTQPLGKEIRIGPEKFDVVGVLKKRGSMFGQSRDNFVGIPITTLMKYFPYDLENLEIIAAPRKHGYLPDAMEEIISILRKRRKVGFGKPNDFAVFTQETIIGLYNQLTGASYLVIIVISSIGLLVGGIGVMNIMLVSVLERTREIGIRKALGARDSDIWSQFLIEAALLTFTGGIVGVIFGWGISYLINSMEIMTTVVSINIVILSVSVAIGIGLFFGFYPAWNASRLNPIEALRSE